MNVELWVTALRILAAILAISVVWPNLLQPWRRVRREDAKADTRRGYAMTTVVWAMALMCWSTAAVLVVSMLYPDFFRPHRPATGRSGCP
jgi:hypothetical protein